MLYTIDDQVNLVTMANYSGSVFGVHGLIDGAWASAQLFTFFFLKQIIVQKIPHAKWVM